jgi:excisionase family DNA binding protein
MTLLTVEETAAILRLSVSAIYAMSGNELPVHRVGPKGGSIRIAREDIDAYLSKTRTGEPAREKRASPRPRLKHIQL